MVRRQHEAAAPSLLGALGAGRIHGGCPRRDPADEWRPPADLRDRPARHLCLLLPFARESWATGRGRAVYDEFEQTAILTATARAFATFLGLVTLLLGWLAIAPKWDWPTPQGSGPWIGWLLTMLVVGTSLPATFAEFMVPMPEPEDEPL
ncbi:hypothetical protein P0F65_18955 [Sphingomonas sp. I4]